MMPGTEPNEHRRIPRRYDLETLRKALETTQHNPEEAKRVALDIVSHMVRQDESNEDLKEIMKDAWREYVAESKAAMIHKFGGWIFFAVFIGAMWILIAYSGFKRNY